MDNDSLFSSNEEGTKSYKESPMKFDSQKNIGVVVLLLFGTCVFTIISICRPDPAAPDLWGRGLQHGREAALQ